MDNIDFQTRHNLKLTEIKILIRQFNSHQPDFLHKIRLSQKKLELIEDLYVRTKRDFFNINYIDHPQEFLDYLFKNFCCTYNRNERKEE